VLIFTIGHSDHTTAAFIELLHQHGIALVVDVRSQPYSRWMPQFNRETLKQDLEDAGIHYEFMGDTLGGRPADRALYDPGQERPNYGRVEETPNYQSGISRLLALVEDEHVQPVTLMCSEGDYRHCHRHLLISQTLLGKGGRVVHIEPDGATVEAELIPEQLSLFGL